MIPSQAFCTLRELARARPPPRAAVPFYRDDLIEVYVGDWRDVLPARLAELGLGADDVALMHADPPYGTGEHHDQARRGRGREAGGARGRLVGGRGRPRAHDWPDTAGNDIPFDPSELLAYPRLITWGANHYASRLPDVPPSWLVWDKREGTGSDHGADAELAWTSLGGGVRVYSHLWRGVCRRSEGLRHLGPTQKPIALMEWAFALAKLRPGDLVLVPFLGTGPELAVCRKMGLRCLAADISPYWCDVAVRERLLDPRGSSRSRARDTSIAARRARPRAGAWS